MLDRRTFLGSMGAGLAVAANPVSLAFANAPTENRLVFVVLRGGLDGLHALPPYADKDYRTLRPTLAIGAPGSNNGALDLDGHFGLHPALKELLPFYKRGEMIVIPASTTRYRNRSHFDGQNLLENGSGKPYGTPDGFLNRALTGLNAGDARLGLALGPAVPLILQGEAGVQAWARSKLPAVDEDFLGRLAQVYKHDPLFARALANARGSAKPDMSMDDMQAPRGGEKFNITAKAAAQLLATDDGPRVAVMEMQGWDTHFGQERRLSNLFTELGEGMTVFRDEIGDAWSNTTFIIVSEFGRTVSENGSRGTDHGTGGIAFLLGGAVNGGRIVGDWPGLSEASRYEGRDLNPVNAYEGIFKAALISKLGLAQGFVEDKVLPNSSSIRPWDGLFKSA